MNLTPKANSSLFLVFVFLFCSNNALATIKLTDPIIDQWIQSQSAFATWGKENEQKLSATASATKTKQTDTHQNPMNMSITSLIQPLKASGLYDSASALVRQYQFSSLEQWADITIRITTAAAAIELENNPRAMDTSELEALQNSSKLSPEQKELITQAIKQNQTMAKQLIDNSSDIDKQAVMPFLKRIHRLMNEPY